MNESTIRPSFRVLEWVGDESGYLRLLDQTLLPMRQENIDCRDTAALAAAIKRLVVRGAPAIGVAGGYGVVLAGQEAAGRTDFASALKDNSAALASARPTAVNLSWATARVLRRGLEAFGAGGDSAVTAALRAMLAEARAIDAEDQAMCLRIGASAAPLVRACHGVLTHCNAGALATAGIGTATAGMYVAHAAGHRFTVYCDETRPLLQGSRLTAWELARAGIDAVVITDGMAAQVMRENRVQMVIVGADRIAANGDTANKIGTYGLAMLARRHGIGFYVAAPYSTFDMSIATGSQIPIEQRAAAEIVNGFGRATAPEGIKTYNPAFDVTPADLITGIVTDRGIIKPVNARTIKAAM